jgi:cysteinyl-tRNA synthetase
MLYLQIIKRARQNHLVDELKSRTTSLTPELLVQVDEAWSQYARSQLFPGLPDTDRPAVGEEKTQWSKLLTLNENVEWRAGCLKRDEKFGMHFTAVVRCYQEH